MSSEERNNINNGNNSNESIGTKIASFFICIHRANVRYFKNLPTKIKSLILRKINDIQNKPKRTEINKVYTLVGYTTKQNIDNKYNDEHLLITLRKALLVIIFVMILFIGFEWLIPQVNFDQAKQIFGISNVEEMTNNDPFTLENKGDTRPTDLLTLDNETTQGS